VGGGYGPDGWIPDLPTPRAQTGESLNEYVYRVMDGRMEVGATPRGLVSNPDETKEQVASRVRELHERRYRQEMAEFERAREESRLTGKPIPERYQSMPVLRTPGIRQLGNDLSRLALEVMRVRAAAAGVVWQKVEDVPPKYRQWFTPLPAGHLVLEFLKYAEDPSLLESTLQSGWENFRRLTAEYFHDSRWFLDLSRRKRDVYFGGRK